MKSTLLIFSFFIFANLNAQKADTRISRWHSSDKIEMSDFQSVKKSELFYCLSNDNDNIYLELRIPGKEDQNMILRGGLILWLNMDGKSIKKLGVRYPVGSQTQAINKKSPPPGSNPDQEHAPGTLLSMANTIELIGFVNEQERRFPSDNPDNFRGWVRYDNGGILYYRMVMPVARLPVRNSKEANGTMPFTIGIEFGFLPAMNPKSGNMKQTPSSSNQTGEYHGGSSRGKRPATGSHTERGSKMSSAGIGRNSKSDQTAGGSDLYWIKDVKLATSK